MHESAEDVMDFDTLSSDFFRLHQISSDFITFASNLKAQEGTMADSDFGTMHLAPTRPERPEQNRKIRVTDRISTEFLLLVEQLLQQKLAAEELKEKAQFRYDII